MSGFTPWSPTGPLSPGVTLIEASAGTGKTWNITGLVARLVAERGVPIDRILVVTYTRAATAELKDRIRARLVDALAAVGGGETADPVLAHLAADPGSRALRQRRLRDAIASFDQALISTIHGFCQRMLQQNALESGVAFDDALTPDLDPLIAEIVDDRIASALYDADPDQVAFLRDRCGLRRDALLALARQALSDPDTAVRPSADADDPSAWDALIDALRADWPALGASFVQALGEEIQAARVGRPSAFKRGQTRVNARDAAGWVAAIGAWLGDGPAFGRLPPAHDAFGESATRDQLADRSAPFRHRALDRLDAVCALPDRVASGLRARIVAEIRAAFDERKAARGLVAYQDLLRGLALRLDERADPAGREALAAAIGGAFDAALIDEFQDTDHAQWTVFREVFGRGAHHLYLIGDPKQAIYGFRGANVHVYAEASASAGARRFTMATNWRSDRPLLDALNHLLDRPAMFGPSAAFGYVRVAPPDGRGEAGLRAPGDPAPLQLRWFDAGLLDDEPSDRPLAKGRVSDPLAARVAEDIAALLGSGARIAEAGGWRPVRPADIAVLVRKGGQALAMQGALRAAGVPAVLTGAASVFASDEALQVQRWLAALAERPGGPASRALATTPLCGWTAEGLRAVDAERPDAVARWDRWLARLAEWGQTHRRRGFMPAFRRALDDEGALARLLGLDDGERRVTNLLHVAELAHAAETRDRLHLAALLAWLAARRSDGGLDQEDAELRLDRDAMAAQILTVHKSKGLEFPICFIPYLWDGGQVRPGAREPLLVPDPARPTRRLLDVGLPTEPAHRALAEQEAREEALRLAYVALTRARHRAVVYAGAVRSYALSPWAAILHGDGPDRLFTGAERVRDAPGALRGDLEALAADSDGTIAVSVCEPPSGASWRAPTAEAPSLSTRSFRRRELDPAWRRHSYSSVSREAGEAELVEDGREGFDADAVDPGVAAVAPPADEVPLAAFPGGAEAGTLLHEILEHADFTWALSDDDPGLRALVERALAAHGFEARHADRLVDGLRRALLTPLGGPLGDLPLAAVTRASRLDELRFDLPILGGSRTPPGSDLEAPARGLVAALRARSDALPGDWLRSLNRLDGMRLAGFLTGSIDLVFRAPDRADRSWFVVDYKSNRLSPDGSGRCVPEGFGPDAMRSEMAHHDYFLQAHLYLVALHRLLRWRLPDYDYDAHVGGAYYLFLRGMVGPDTVRERDAVRGCWFDRPPRAVIEAIDRALAGEGL